MNLTRFRAKGTLPSHADRRVQAHAAVPIQPETTTERETGWCQHGDELNLRPVWNHNNVVLMDLRIETMKAPGKELKRLVRQRVADFEKEGEPVTSGKRREIRDVLKMDLRKKIPSKITTIPMLWHLAEDRLYLFTQSQSVIDSFIILFANTFEQSIDNEGLLSWCKDVDPMTGPTFLTWLFFRSSQNNGEWMLPGLDRFTVQIGDKIRLGHGEAVAHFAGDGRLGRQVDHGYCAPSSFVAARRPGSSHRVR